MSDLAYPIGKFTWSGPASAEDRARQIAELAAAPAALRDAVAGLSDAQLETPYRPGGWTVRQVVHHVPDSHLNAYVRFKLAVTEETPTIKPYDEKAWAELPDVRTVAVEASLDLLARLHERWVAFLLRSFRERLAADVPASGARRRPAREEPGALRLARPASRRARDVAPEEDGLGLSDWRSAAPETRQRARTARRSLAAEERGLARRSSGEARTTSREISRVGADSRALRRRPSSRVGPRRSETSGSRRARRGRGRRAGRGGRRRAR